MKGVTSSSMKNVEKYQRNKARSKKQHEYVLIIKKMK